MSIAVQNFFFNFDAASRNPEKEAATLELLALRLGKTTQQVQDLALNILAVALSSQHIQPGQTLSLVNWHPCQAPGCDCGGLVPIIAANLILPEFKPVH